MSGLLSVIRDRCLVTLGYDIYFRHECIDVKVKQLLPFDLWLTILCYLGREKQEIELIKMFDLKENDYSTLIRMKYPFSHSFIKNRIMKLNVTNWKFLYCNSIMLEHFNCSDIDVIYDNARDQLNFNLFQTDVQDIRLMKILLGYVKN